MGNSTLSSNIVGKLGSEKITNVASVCSTGVYATELKGTSLTGTGALTGATIVATSYITVGTNKYIFSGSPGENSASIVEAASALVGVSKKGSIYMANVVWGFDTDGTATKLK